MYLFNKIKIWWSKKKFVGEKKLFEVAQNIFSFNLLSIRFLEKKIRKNKYIPTEIEYFRQADLQTKHQVEQNVHFHFSNTKLFKNTVKKKTLIKLEKRF